MISISVFFIGGLMAVGIRLELATPEGDFVSADAYNKFFTLHGVIMVLHRTHAPGTTWFRRPLFVWAHSHPAVYIMAILLSLTMVDYGSRMWVNPPAILQ